MKIFFKDLWALYGEYWRFCKKHWFGMFILLPAMVIGGEILWLKYQDTKRKEQYVNEDDCKWSKKKEVKKTKKESCDEFFGDEE